MAYSTVADVKAKLGLPTADTDHDTDLQGFIAQADSRIDQLLAQNTSVPLTTVPEAIKHISADLAAAAFTGRPFGQISPEAREWAEQAEASAMQRLQEYRRNNYGRPSLHVPLLEDTPPP